MANKLIKGLTVEIGGDTTKLSKALQDVESKSIALSKELNDINRLLKLDPGNTELLAQKQKVLADAIDSCAKKLKTLKEAEKQVQQQFEKGEVSEEQVRALQREIVATENKMAGYERAAREIANETDKLGDEAEQTETSIHGLDSALEKAGDGFTVFKGVVADLVADGIRLLVDSLKEAATYALQTGMDFESAMSQVVAVSGATGDEVQALTDKAKEMGAKTKFSAKESADAFNYMAMAGWKTEDMLNGIEGIMDLAAAAGADLATTSDIVTDALTAMGYSAGDAGQLADVMAAASSNANTNVEMMGETFKYAAPLAGALGYNMEDTAVAIGLMANAGIKGSQAGTSLRSILTRLAKPTKQSGAAMDALGISLTDAQGKMLPFSDIMDQMRTSFAGLTEEEQASYAAMLGGQEAMSGLLAIVNAAPEDYEKLTEAVNNSEGAAKRMADTMQDNLAGDIEELGGAFDTLAIEISEKFNGSLRDGVQAITDFVSGETSMTDMLARLGDAVSQAITALKGYLPQMAQMGQELLVNLVNGLTVGLPILLDKAVDLVAQLGTAIANQAPTIVTVAGSLLTSFAQGVANFIPQLITSAAEIVGSLANGIQGNASSFVSKALDLLDGFADKLTSALPKLIESGMNFILNLVKGLMQALPEFIQRAPEIISKFANLINDNVPMLLAKGAAIIWEIIKGIVSAIPELVKNAPKIITAIVDVWEAFNWVNLGKKGIEMLTKGVKSMVNAAKTAGTNIKDSIVNAIKNLPEQLKKLGSDGISKLGSAIKSGISAIKSAASSVFDGIVSAFKNLPSKMLSIGKDLVRGLWNGISDMTGWVIGKLESFGDSVLSGIKKFFGIKSPSKEFAKIGMYLDQGLAEGLLDYANDPIKAAKEMASGVLDGASMDGLSLERDLQDRNVQRALSVTTSADSTMLGKLDKILTAIEKGQVLTLDGKKLIGGTVNAYDTALGQRRMLAARGAI